MKIIINNPETFGAFSFPCGDDALENLMKQYYPQALETRTIPVHEFIIPKEFAFLNGQTIDLDELNFLAKYGYLKRDVKDLIDSIVDLLAEDENIQKLYDLWYEKKHEILKTYTDSLPPKIPLSQNKEFKSIKNEIIREALRIRVDGSGKVHVLQPYQKTSCAPAVGRLFGYLCNLFREKVLDDEKNQPMVDKKQRREIEEKKQGEITY